MILNDQKQQPIFLHSTQRAVSMVYGGRNDPSRKRRGNQDLDPTQKAVKRTYVKFSVTRT